MNENNKSENIDKYRKLGIFIDNIEIPCLIFAKSNPKNACNHVIFVVKNGCLSLEVKGKLVKLHKNEGFLLRKGVKYEVCEENVTKELINLECIYFNGNGTTNILDYLGFKEAYHFSISGNTGQMCYDALKKYQLEGEYFRAAIALQQFLIAARESGVYNLRDLNMENVYTYMNEHFKEPMDLNILSSYYGSSISYFSRAFKSAFHETPMNYVNRIRIDHARMLLTSTTMNISAISEECGFDKMEYFCYVFKKYEGCTPTQYRLRKKNVKKDSY